MRKLENKQLDEIAKALVRADALSSRDLEYIADKPDLFDSIRTRIASESRVPAKRRTYFRPGIAVFASMAIVAAFAAGFVMFKSKPGDVAVEILPPAPLPRNDVPRFSEPDRIVDPGLRPTVENIRAVKTSPRPSAKLSGLKRSAAQEIREEAGFYAVSYAGDPHETERGGRIVRVDIPRSTLFAMGVDIPLENDAEVVRADLLIGPDGVTRGIRVVE